MLIAVFAVIIVYGFKKGFLSTLVDTLALGISAVASYIVTPKISDYIYENFVNDMVMTRFSKALDEAPGGLGIVEKVAEMVDSLPASAVAFAESMGMNLKIIAKSFSEGISNDELVETLAEKVGSSIMIPFIEIIVFVLLFIVCTLLVRLIAKILKKANDIPLLGKLNGLLGGVLGLVKAVLIVFVVCLVAHFVLKSSDNTTIVSVIENSKIFQFFNELDYSTNLL
ncbi:MAG: CvpA family protein [Acutalibacteraceae bacterium]